jgi:hypothetical protein
MVILVDKGDISTMTKELLELIINKDKRILFNKNNDNYIKNKFSLKKITHELNSIYYSICMKKIIFLSPYPKDVAPSQRLKYEQYYEAH